MTRPDENVPPETTPHPTRPNAHLVLLTGAAAEGFQCGRCGGVAPTGGDRYTCGFESFHTSCALVGRPPVIKHPLFPGSVFVFGATTRAATACAMGCGESVSGLAYHSKSRLSLHPGCCGGDLPSAGDELVQLQLRHNMEEQLQTRQQNHGLKKYSYHRRGG